MLGYSKVINEVFTLPGEKPLRVHSRIDLESKFLRISELTWKHWRALVKFQGFLTVLYLSLRYGSRDTFVSLAFIGDTLVYVQWLVPTKKIQKRYPFVSKDSYAIISCLTSEEFRGKRIYPSQIQEAVRLDTQSKEFWIWADSENMPSLRGIRKAGGMKVGKIVQKRWLWGIISRVRFYQESDEEELSKRN